MEGIRNLAALSSAETEWSDESSEIPATFVDSLSMQSGHGTFSFI
jgi:hypothetical protein